MNDPSYPTMKFSLDPRFILWGHWLPLFWTLCDPSHEFHSQGGSLTCTLTWLHAVNLRVQSGATPAFSTNRSVNCVVYTYTLFAYFVCDLPGLHCIKELNFTLKIFDEHPSLVLYTCHQQSTLNCPFNLDARLISTNFPHICSAKYSGSTVCI